MKKNLTDIMCIGAQKASTSWLHHIISIHPSVQPFQGDSSTAENKESHFWDWNYEKGIDWYKDLMRVDKGKLSLDFTPEYALIDEDRIKECKKYNPTAKIIYVLRDPLCRAISSLRMYILRDKGTDTSFKLEYDDYFLNAINESLIVRHSEYYKNYWTWKQHYDDILLLNYEDICSNRDEMIKHIYKYLELDINDMDEETRSEFNIRVEGVVWRSTEFEISRDCIMFLEGMLHQKRKYFEYAFKFKFEEHNLFLEK